MVLFRRRSQHAQTRVNRNPIISRNRPPVLRPSFRPVVPAYPRCYRKPRRSQTMPRSTSLLISPAKPPRRTRAAHPAINRFPTPLFSSSSESLFSQLLYFHNHLRCPIDFSSVYSVPPASAPSVLSRFFKSFPVNGLRALALSCASFRTSNPLFSIACTLFCKNTGGWGCPPATNHGQESRVTESHVNEPRSNFFRMSTHAKSRGGRSPIRASSTVQCSRRANLRPFGGLNRANPR